MKHREILEETERLILRRYVEEDLEDLLEYLSDGEVVRALQAHDAGGGEKGPCVAFGDG